MDHRFQLLAEGAHAEDNVFEFIPPPELPYLDAPYTKIVNQFLLQSPERLILILCLIPHIKPQLLDVFFVQNPSLERGFTEFGGITGHSHSGFLPTGETAMFLLAYDNLAYRLHYDALFTSTNVLFVNGILHLEHPHNQEPPLSAALSLSSEYRTRILTGQSYTPTFGAAFPAQRITTELEWHDLVLDTVTRQEIHNILSWILNKDVLLDEWQLKRRLQPGFRSLFYGPPGTGKTLTACVLGKKSGLPVFRVDLSNVLSKYIGETEKSLARLFDQAQHHDWILFFDEADALFGKRVEAQTSNDRAANQQVAYLLQRIENYPGLAILATNLRTHFDEAFARRFQSMIQFPIPTVEQRLQLWQDHFMNQAFTVDRAVDFERLAQEYELTGGDILNVLQYVCIQAVNRDAPTIDEADLLAGIHRELQKGDRLDDSSGATFWGATPSRRRETEFIY